MSKIWSVLFISVFSLGASAQAQNETPEKESEIKTAEQAEQTVEREAAEDEGDDQAIFLPTEKINVDSSVSFPVDI